MKCFRSTFYVEFMLDEALSHKIHMQVMNDIYAKFTPKADVEAHRITNQAMVDLAHAPRADQVKLASFHAAARKIGQVFPAAEMPNSLRKH